MSELPRIDVKQLPLNQITDQGRYWAELDGEKVGWNGRAFWETASDARACAVKNLMKKDN